MSRYEGKRILITGGSSGIGLAGARRIVAEGGNVAITGLNDQRLDQARATLPDSSLILKSDTASEADIDKLRKAVEDWGTLDGLWLNAGIAEVDALESITAESFNRLMNTNVRGPMLQLAALAVRGIRANTSVPGLIETNFRHFMPNDSRPQFEELVVNQGPLGRAGSAEEAAAVALFLLSDDATYVTGSQYAVDGGLIHY